MRLLEFDSVDSGASRKTALLGQKPAKNPARSNRSPRRSSVIIEPPEHVQPIKGNAAVEQTARRAPIDLEQLQQRIDVLERRLRERVRLEGSRMPVKDLQQLKQRMKLLERSVHNELWAARQREHSLLELLARPPLKTVILKGAKRFTSHTLPAAGRWLWNEYCEWWRLSQPLWWPQLVRAWQESYDKARGIHRP